MKLTGSHVLAMLWGALALVCSGASEQSVCAYSWSPNSFGTAGESVSPTVKSLSVGQTATFTATPANGLWVSWWAEGPGCSTQSIGNRGGIKDAEGRLVTNLVTHATTYEFARETDDTRYYVGVCFEYFPYVVRLNKNAPNDGASETMPGTRIYTDSFSLMANPFTREGYSFANWTNAVGTVLADGTDVTGQALGITRYDQGVASYDESADRSIVNLQAVWTANTYEVAFHGNGATGGAMANQKLAYDEPEALTANAYSQEIVVSFDGAGGTSDSSGKTAVSIFRNWTNEVGRAYADGETVKNLTSEDGAAIDLYATWKPGSVTLPSASRSGHAFAGWYTEASGGSRVGGVGDSYTPTSAVTLYAHWSANGYTVAFHGNGATAGSMSNQSFTYGVAQTLRPNAFSRSFSVSFNGAGGTPLSSVETAVSTFNGWTNSVGETYANEASVLNLATSGTVDLYATWTPGAVTLPSATRSGHVFNGWYAAASGGARIGGADESFVPSAATTLYAQWTANACTVTFRYYVKATLTNETRSVSYGESVPASEVPDPDRRLGYTFSHWYGSYQNVTDDRSVVAQYDENSYTIRFDPNGGVGSMSDQVLKYSDERSLAPNLYSRPGHEFLGWALEQTATTVRFADQQRVSSLSSENGGTVTLYAVWSAVVYSISFDANGGTGTMPVQTVPRDQETPLSPNAFVRNGCTFGGWATNSPAVAVVYTNGAHVTNLAPANETNTMYAVWSNNAYTVAFHPNGGEGTMENQAFRCHEPQNLSSVAFTRVNGTFVGWARDPTNAVPEFADRQEVTNLTCVADATIRLYAVWELPQPGTASELAIALDRPRGLEFSSGGETARLSIVTNATASDCAPGGNNQYVRFHRPEKASYSTLSVTSELPEATGKLAFWYRAAIDEGTSGRGAFTFTIGSDLAQLTSTTSVVEWTRFEYVKTNKTEEGASWKFLKRAGKTDDTVDVDLVTWTPDDPELPTVGVTFRLNDGTASPDDIWENLTVSSGVKFTSWPLDPTSASGASFAGWHTATTGGELVTSNSVAPVVDTVYYAQWGSAFPVPAEKDRVEASAVTVVDGTVGISFAADESFAYYLLATDSLSPVDWQRCLGPTNGTGTLIFAPPIDAEHPQRFFKIETVQREK